MTFVNAKVFILFISHPWLNRYTDPSWFLSLKDSTHKQLKISHMCYFYRNMPVARQPLTYELCRRSWCTRVYLHFTHCLVATPKTNKFWPLCITISIYWLVSFFYFFFVFLIIIIFGHGCHHRGLMAVYETFKLRSPDPRPGRPAPTVTVMGVWMAHMLRRPAHKLRLVRSAGSKWGILRQQSLRPKHKFTQNYTHWNCF